jgi:hypothetical protein
MIKLNEIKKGDYVIADNDGDKKTGEVVDLRIFNKQVCIDEGTNEYWYDIKQISAIPLSERALMDLRFKKIVNTDGTVKFSKGAFRMVIPKEDDFSKMEIWYRDERRHIFHPMTVHELQNYFHEMTKVYLNEVSFD